MTATQLKGRAKDIEISQDTSNEQIRKAIGERFERNYGRGKAFGNAIHAVMQYISYDSCDNKESVCAEIERLASNGLLSEEQARLVDVDKIVRFFSSPLGRKLTGSHEILREFKFSLLCSANEFYTDGSPEDQVLLQGVVDCAVIEDDGITVIDFKTDRVYDNAETVLNERYGEQIRTYGKALSRMFNKPVKELLIYSFYLSEYFCVSD